MVFLFPLLYSVLKNSSFILQSRSWAAIVGGLVAFFIPFHFPTRGYTSDIITILALIFFVDIVTQIDILNGMLPNDPKLKTAVSFAEGTLIGWLFWNRIGYLIEPY